MHTNATHQEGLGQRTAGQVGRELLSRQPLLTVFAGLMLVLALPTAVMLAVDDRTWRDVAIWAKPLKFMASTALFLGEPLPPWKLVAAALIIGGLALNLLATRQPAMRKL
jgi:drug/metabolite transporter (DMT)-like permease